MTRPSKDKKKISANAKAKNPARTITALWINDYYRLRFSLPMSGPKKKKAQENQLARSRYRASSATKSTYTHIYMYLRCIHTHTHRRFCSSSGGGGGDKSVYMRYTKDSYLRLARWRGVLRLIGFPCWLARSLGIRRLYYTPRFSQSLSPRVHYIIAELRWRIIIYPRWHIRKRCVLRERLEPFFRRSYIYESISVYIAFDECYTREFIYKYDNIYNAPKTPSFTNLLSNLWIRYYIGEDYTSGAY